MMPIEEKIVYERDEREYCPLSEEVPVTFQVGMVGSDGVVLASDTLQTKISYAKGSVRSTYSSDKILSPKPGFAYCCATQNQFEKVTAERFILDFCGGDEQDFRDKLNRAEKLVSETWTKIPGEEARPGTILFAYKSENEIQLWHVANLRTPRPIINHVKDKVAGGDTGNAACFFLERYFPKGSARSALPTVNRLLPLAAHCVLMAGRLNPTGVGG